MGGALLYLLLTRLKNSLKSLINSPGKLIYLIIMVALIVVTIIGGKSSAGGADHVYRDIREFNAIVIALYTAMFIIIAVGGFSKGGNIFSLSDVNFIFPAPISQQRVLFYGLFRQMGMSLMVGIFILYQYSWTHMTYGISYGRLLIVLLGYALAVFFGQITAMVIYSFTSGDERLKRMIQTAFYAVFAIFGLYLVWSVLTGPQTPLQNLVSAASGTVIRLLPVGGWLGSAFATAGSTAGVLTGLGISFVYLVILVCLIVFSKRDYYEDVLKTAEISQSAITAQREGRMNEAIPANVKLGKTGLNGGFGADAFYYKHLLENRRSRKLLVSTTSLIWILVSIVLAFFMRNLGIASVFISTTYMQITAVALGRISRELSKPYIFLVPEPPFAKLIQNLRESFFPALAEAALIYVPVAFIMKLSPLDMVLCIVARMSFAMLFTSGLVLIERIWSGVSKTFAILLYFAVMLLISVPGIAAAILMTSFHLIVSENFTILVSLTAVNVPISLLVLYLCRNMLQYAQLNK